MNCESVFFLAPNSLLALIMLKHFQSFTGVKMTNIMSAPTDDDRFMISGDVPMNTFASYSGTGIQELTQETGSMFSLKTVDKVFHMYQITMM